MDEQRRLHRIRPLPPFGSYPLIAKKTLVPHSAENGVLPVRTFTFAYPSDVSLSFEPAHHLKLVRPGPYKPRSYTPTSDAYREGSFDLTIKIYPGGNSEWLDNVSIGDRVTMIGPLPLPFKAKVYKPGPFVVVVALGIGITLGYIGAKRELDRNGFVTLVYSIRRKEEAIFGDELDELKQKYPDRFEIKMIASREHVEGWQHGRLTEDLMHQFIPDAPKDDIRFLVVGTKQMMKSIWSILRGMGYNQAEHALIRKRFKS
ncbi:NADH-cytochrome b5 reductase 2 [Gracilariopsis chorda]|uniref:NADH-cytochrome b5 reductase 2 n=1 Tax=Gracilariopsis chorda TaxID=448386 RepID=A0A2V3IUW7_9FLOR|nr:NADH-cytochrome b5 reductase 2 [Gracilariopsis chorda]|eukprot:PXF45914.1 NADH-cytochrome b5 reductase 2 [Gracilariopsis chorda]